MADHGHSCHSVTFCPKMASGLSQIGMRLARSASLRSLVLLRLMLCQSGIDAPLVHGSRFSTAKHRRRMKVFPTLVVVLVVVVAVTMTVMEMVMAKMALLMMMAVVEVTCRILDLLLQGNRT